MKKKVYFFCVFLIFRICSSLARKDTTFFAFMQIIPLFFKKNGGTIISGHTFSYRLE